MEQGVNQVIHAELRPTVLIVDDEEGIRKSLQDILQDEGLSCLLAADGASALELLGEFSVDLVLLDIWMPGLDGLEVLQKIQEQLPELPVVMISGHATIATAVQATKMGAFDFIEKPLDLHTTLRVVRRGLQQSTSAKGEDHPAADQDSAIAAIFRFDRESVLQNLERVVFSKQLLPGKALPQKTIARSSILYGQGLHSGTKSGLMLEPLPANSGIHFVGVSDQRPVPAHVNYVESTGFATTIRLDRTEAATIEHLMSALHVYGITNLLVKCNGEVPVLDGSALKFCDLLDETGVVEQASEVYAIQVKEPISFGEGREQILLEPHDRFVVHYTLDYPAPLGKQEFEFTLDDIGSYRSEIAPARTFGFVRDIGYLQGQGLAQGGRFDNFVLYGEQGPINGKLRFPDEAVRHKILDVIGDLYLLGRPIQGKVTALMTGHSDNVQLLRRVWEAMQESVTTA